MDRPVLSGLQLHKTEWIDYSDPVLHGAIGNLTRVEKVIMSTKHAHYDCPDQSPSSPRRLRDVFVHTLALLTKLNQPLPALNECAEWSSAWGTSASKLRVMRTQSLSDCSAITDQGFRRLSLTWKNNFK